MKNRIKNIFKDFFLILKIRNRFYPSTQISQRQLFLSYQDSARNKNLPKLKDTGFRVFSQFEEDGKLLFIFWVIRKHPDYHLASPVAIDELAKWLNASYEDVLWDK